jgi:glucan 1,3-beta-glucosidase
MKGVNLGGWLVLERWMTPKVFKDAEAFDEYTLASLGKRYRIRIQQHHMNFITEADFKWLSRHVDVVRIPVGYWIFGDEEPHVKGIESLDWAFMMAEKYNIKILLSIHGASGSQNGKMHSGCIGECRWQRDEHHREKTRDITQRLVKRYKNSPQLWGIGLLNEPLWRVRSIGVYLKYYFLLKRDIHAVRPDLKIYISDWFAPKFGLLASLILGVGLDCHVYPSFGEKNPPSKTMIYRKTHLFQHFLKWARYVRPIIIGEWSVVMGASHRALSDDQTKKTWLIEYAKKQLNIYDQAEAWFYFSYETDGRGTWSFRDMVEKGIIKL